MTARLASPLPTHLLRICAGALKRPEQWGISKFASGKEPTGLFARKHLLTPYTGEAMGEGENPAMTCRKARRKHCCARVSHAFTTLPPRFARHPPLHREGYEKNTCSPLTQGRLWEGNRSPLEKAPSSRQGGLVCGALRLPHDPMRLLLLFPQTSPCDFCGSPVFYSLSHDTEASFGVMTAPSKRAPRRISLFPCLPR